MRTIIAGSRYFTDMPTLEKAIEDSGFDITEVVCGCARGVDTLGKEWAENYGVQVALFPADWQKFGKAAGPIRNQEMAEYGDSLILLWNPESSRGSRSMLREAKKLNLDIFTVDITV
jgi:hypothetical protein